MDVVGSEIGQKMRSAIKAKLTELGCYVDDELPDYVMVMVANKRTRAQMEDDLQLFLGDNTELFVNWLHQVLKKLQEVTVTAPKPPECEKSKEKERSLSKERKSKEKKAKDKSKKSDLKKAKKKEKEKEKLQKKKIEKKSHKKKKSKHHEMIRPNIPPLLMNMEKVSEPSITDVFAGQILKNHGILIDTIKEDPKEEKPIVNEVKRPILPIIDPATIISEPTETNTEENESAAPREEQLKEINEIEAKIQGLKQKLAEQLDSMSDDEDFLNIRTEAEELMNDFAEDVFQEISQQTPALETPPAPTAPSKSPTPPKSPPRPPEISKPPPKELTEVLPQIELKLPKRPIRERLGAREDPKKVPEKEVKEKEVMKAPDRDSPESFTPERELEPPRAQSKSAKSRLGEPPESKRKQLSEETHDKAEPSSKRLTSKVSVLENRSSGRATCESVVRVRPRPRVPVPNSLLLRAVADAHKSLLNIPPKVDPEPQKIKRALVLPMRRCVDAQKILIQVPGADRHTADETDAISLGDPDSEDDKSSKKASDAEKEEYTPRSLTKVIHNSDYTPSRRHEGRTSTRKNDTLIIETINIHNPTVDKDKNTQFIVTMDGFNPNAFLAKKLQTEGLLNDDDVEMKDLDPKKEKKINKGAILENAETAKETENNDRQEKEKNDGQQKQKQDEIEPGRRLSNTSEKSEESVVSERTKESEREKVVENTEIGDQDKVEKDPVSEKIKTCERSKVSEISTASEKSKASESPIIIKEEKTEKRKSSKTSTTTLESPRVKKRKSSPIVFGASASKKDGEKERQRTESVGSDNHVTVTTTMSTHKYDSLPPLLAPVPTAEKKPVWCRAFPTCRYGATCAFLHPRCKFASACSRRNCPYSHTATAAPLSPAPVVASHVVPAANYKSISTTTLPAMCKFYPACANPACHYFHPKPCRFGRNCGNKLECNFYHVDVPGNKWRYPV